MDLSADGKTATYKYDAVELLRSMPEGATLKVAVADKGNVRREATFELPDYPAFGRKSGRLQVGARDRENLIRKPLKGEQPRALNRAPPYSAMRLD